MSATCYDAIERIVGKVQNLLVVVDLVPFFVGVAVVVDVAVFFCVGH